MAKLDKRRLREVRYTDKRRLRGAVFSQDLNHMCGMLKFWEKLRPQEVPFEGNKGDRTFYDAINLHMTLKSGWI